MLRIVLQGTYLMRRSVWLVWVAVMMLVGQISTGVVAAVRITPPSVDMKPAVVAAYHNDHHRAAAHWGRQQDLSDAEPSVIQHHCDSRHGDHGIRLHDTADRDCGAASDCDPDHCTTSHALTSAFHPALDNTVSAQWPRLALTPVPLLLPPPGQPPKRV